LGKGEVQPFSLIPSQLQHTRYCQRKFEIQKVARSYKKQSMEDPTSKFHIVVKDMWQPLFGSMIQLVPGLLLIEKVTTDKRPLMERCGKNTAVVRCRNWNLIPRRVVISSGRTPRCMQMRLHMRITPGYQNKPFYNETLGTLDNIRNRK